MYCSPQVPISSGGPAKGCVTFLLLNTEMQELHRYNSQLQTVKVNSESFLREVGFLIFEIYS